MKKICIWFLTGVMMFSITACGSSSETTDSSKDVPEVKVETQVDTDALVETDTTVVEETEAITEEEIETTSQEEASDNIDPEFKKTMDGYEAFFDEYCEFMKKYSESDDTTSMLADYSSYLASYADVTAKLNDIDEDELSEAELLYYTEVNARITEKLAEVAQY